jgi:hypothetical protein
MDCAFLKGISTTIPGPYSSYSRWPLLAEPVRDRAEPIRSSRGCSSYSLLSLRAEPCLLDGAEDDPGSFGDGVELSTTGDTIRPDVGRPALARFVLISGDDLPDE